MKKIREVRHENIISFIGACVDYDNICVLIAYCARGSLEDVLGNNDLHLDTMFVSSLVADILKGMIYLHDSEIISHGNLRSSNCLVDSRWVLQISDFGLHEFKAGQEEPNSKAKENKRLLWRAPELLRHPAAPARGTQKADVYSFAIVLYEIVGRAGPWGTQGLSESEIVSRVRCPPDGQLFRPPIDHLDLPDFVEKCMRCCWDEEPEQRPDIRYIRILLKEMHTGLPADDGEIRVQITAFRTKLITLIEAAQHEAVQKEVAQHGAVQKEVAQHGAVQKEVAQHGAVQKEVAQHGAVQKEVAQHEAVQNEVAQHGAVQKEVAQHGAVQKEVAQHGAVQKEVAQHDAWKRQELPLTLQDVYSVLMKNKRQRKKILTGSAVWTDGATPWSVKRCIRRNVSRPFQHAVHDTAGVPRSRYAVATTAAIRHILAMPSRVKALI
uniref:guanylate cyclase n=1 Tax=Timema shepardi TaxID=629360 RepID=A0A7R9B319_TIMSH|nr:unnamed protein product [Timema shepardi]